MPLQRPSSEEGVANLALGKCKEEEIATFDDDVHRARVVRRHFGLVRDALLARLDWNFAASWVVPAADVLEGTGPLPDRFVLPGDCITVRQVFAGATGAELDDELGADEWMLETGRITLAGVEVEAKVLVCEQESITVRYTRRVEAPRLWDPLFMSAMVCLLAAACAPELGRSSSQAQDFLTEAEQILVPLAKRSDSRERSAGQVGGHKLPSWIAARGGRRLVPGKLSS